MCRFRGGWYIVNIPIIKALRSIIRQYRYGQKKPIPKHIDISRPSTLTIDEAFSVLKRDGHTMYTLQVEKAKATVIPQDFNPKRRNLVRTPGHHGLSMWYTTDYSQYIQIANEGRFVRIPEDMIPLLRLGIKRYRDRKFEKPEPKPDKSSDTPPPELKQVSKRGIHEGIDLDEPTATDKA